MSAAAQLSKFDFKNVDMARIQEKFLQRPHLIINMIFIAGTLLSIYHIHSTRKMELVNMKQQIEDLNGKLKAVTNLDATQKNLNDFVKNLPQGMPTAQIISKLTDFAVAHDVQILSFSPAVEEEKPLYKRINVHLDFSTATYSDMVLFIHDIETSPYTLRIEQWSAGLGESAGFRTKRSRSPVVEDTQQYPITARIDIVAINFKK